MGDARDGSVGGRFRLRHSVLDEGVHFFTSSSPALHLRINKIKKKKNRPFNHQHSDFSGATFQDVRRSLGTALADLAGLIGDAERPQFALAPGVRRGGAGLRFNLICRWKQKRGNVHQRRFASA